MQSIGHALNGMRHFITHEAHARIHAVAGLVAVSLGIWLRLSQTEWALVALAIGLVFCTEVLNSSLEKLADALCPHYHKGVGMAKDLAAGAVLIAACVAIAIGRLVFLPALYHLAWSIS